MGKLSCKVVLVLAALACHAGSPPAPQALDFNATDSTDVARLVRHGRRVAGRHAVVWALPAEMSEVWQAALVDSIDRGLAEVRRLMGGTLPWQRIGDRPVEYYLLPQRLISHASGMGAVFISMYRVNRGEAPYLHEAGHELLAPAPPFFYAEYPDTVVAEAWFQSAPYWLMEGLPDVMALRAAAAAGTHEGDVFAVGGLAHSDSTCAARLAGNPFREELLRTLGGRGAVDQLFTTDRSKVAPAFYACSQSLANFVVELLSVQQAAELFPAIKRREWAPALERMTNLPLDSLRARWMARLGLQP